MNRRKDVHKVWSSGYVVPITTTNSHEVRVITERRSMKLSQLTGMLDDSRCAKIG